MNSKIKAVINLDSNAIILIDKNLTLTIKTVTRFSAISIST